MTLEKKKMIFLAQKKENGIILPGNTFDTNKEKFGVQLSLDLSGS